MTESTAHQGSAPAVVFVIGAPRSGTTWLQTLLGSNPAVVTPQETDLFPALIAPLQEGWDRQRARLDDPVGVRAKGLSGVFDDDEFSDVVADIVQRVLTKIGGLAVGAPVIVEKSPSHSHHVALIRRYVPNAAFVHMIRDGRDVVQSLQSAAQGWGSYWATASTSTGAQRWESAVLAARMAAGGDGYTEVRYEDLRAGKSEPLVRAFALCGIDVDEEACAELLERYSLERMRSGEVASPIALGGVLQAEPGGLKEPEGFFGKGRVGGWAATWSDSDRLAFDAVAGDLLVALGYEPNHDWAGPPARRSWYRRRAAAARVVGKAGRRAGKALTRRSARLLSRYPEEGAHGSSPATDARADGSSSS